MCAHQRGTPACRSVCCMGQELRDGQVPGLSPLPFRPAHPSACSVFPRLPAPTPHPCRSGVPPDAFSETGQLWGSPLYEWKAHAAEGFAWWRQRIARSMQVRGGWDGWGWVGSFSAPLSNPCHSE